MHIELMNKVLATYPERPVLNEVEWPYKLGRLDEMVTEYMDLLERLSNLPMKRGQLLRPFTPKWAGDLSKQHRKRKL